MAPPLHLAQDPHAMGGPGIIGRIAEKLVAASFKPVCQSLRTAAEVLRLGQNSQRFIAVCRVVKPLTAPQQGSKQGKVSLFITRCPVAMYGKHFLGGVTPDVPGTEQNLAVTL